jgi:hypothetical protein
VCADVTLCMNYYFLKKESNYCLRKLSLTDVILNLD